MYISKPADYPHAPSKLLLFLTNGTGVHSVNNQLQADRFAKEGFLVVMPDMFAGDAAPNSATTDAAPQDESLLEQVKLRAAETAKSFLLDMWLARHTPEKVLPILHKVVEGTKDEFADAIASGGGVYSVGYCFGAKYTLLLGGEHADTAAWGQGAKDEEQGVVKKGPSIKAGAIAHGTGDCVRCPALLTSWQARSSRPRTSRRCECPCRWSASVRLPEVWSAAVLTWPRGRPALPGRDARAGPEAPRGQQGRARDQDLCRRATRSVRAQRVPSAPPR